MNTKEEWGPANPNGDMAPILQRSIDESAWLRSVEPMGAHNRCDRCGAQAYFRLYRPPTHYPPRARGVLELCNHHHNKNKEALDRDGWAIIESLPLT